MRLFWHLVRKEADDVRWHVRGCLVLIVLLACLGQWAVTRHTSSALQYAGTSVMLWTVVFAFLGGGAVAAEVFAGDATSRRIEGAALLPVGLGRVFLAKVFVVVVATAVLAAWAGGVTPFVALVMASDDAAIRGTAALPDVPWIGIAMLTVVAAISLFSIVFEHGLGAVLGGTVAVGAGGLALVRYVPWDEWGVVPADARGAAIASIPFTLVLGAAAALAFVHGPIHLGRRIRRAALGVGSAVVTVLGGGAVAWAAFEARMDVQPGDAHAVVGAVIGSPDGKYAVLFVGSTRAPSTSHAWLVDVASGRVTPLPGHHMTFLDWTPDGAVRLWAGKWTRAQGAIGVPVVRAWDHVEEFDAASGKLVGVRDQNQLAYEPRTVGWARIARSLSGWVVEWPERRTKREFKDAWLVSVSPRPGRVCVWSAGGTNGRNARVIDLDTDAAREVDVSLPSHPGFLQPDSVGWLDGGRLLRYSSSQPRVHLFDCDTGADRDVQSLVAGNWPLGDGGHAVSAPSNDDSAVVDLRDGRVVAGPWRNRNVWFLQGSERYAVTFGADAPTALLDLVTGRETPVVPDPRGYSELPMNMIRAVPGDRFLVIREGNGLDLIGADGRVVRTVVPAVSR